jgi:hypothetical protein
MTARLQILVKNRLGKTYPIPHRSIRYRSSHGMAIRQRNVAVGLSPSGAVTTTPLINSALHLGRNGGGGNASASSQQLPPVAPEHRERSLATTPRRGRQNFSEPSNRSDNI